MGMVFLFQSPTFLCKQPDGSYKVCEEKIACEAGPENWKIDPNSAKSVALEFELWCEKSYLSGLAGSVYFFGKKKFKNSCTKLIIVVSI